MNDADIEIRLEALRHLQDSVATSFNTTLGFLVVAIGWLIISSRARNAIAAHGKTRMVLLAVIVAGTILHVARLWMLQARSEDVAREIDGYPEVVAAYEVGRADTIGISAVAILLAGALFVLVFWHPPDDASTTIDPP